MKADKTLVAGAAATVQKTLDMSGTFKGMAEVQLQQMQAVNNIFDGIFKRKEAVLKEIEDMQADLFMRGGGKTGDVFNKKVEEANDIQTLSFLKQIRDNISVAQGKMAELIDNPQDINLEATDENDLLKFLHYAQDNVSSFEVDEDTNDAYFVFSFPATTTQGLEGQPQLTAPATKFEVRAKDIENAFNVVKKDNGTVTDALFGINKVLEKREFNPNLLRAQLLKSVDGTTYKQQSHKVATLLTTPIIDGLPTVRDLLKSDFNRILPTETLEKIGLKKPEDIADFVDSLTQPGHENFDLETSKNLLLNFFNNEIANVHSKRNRITISGSMFDNLTGSGRVQTGDNRFELPQKLQQVFKAIGDGKDFDYIGLNFTLDKENGWYDKTEKDRKKDDPFTYYTFEELKQVIDPQGYLSLYDEFQAISPKYSIGGKKQEDEGDINENVDKEPWYKNFFKRRLGTGRPPMSQPE